MSTRRGAVASSVSGSLMLDLTVEVQRPKVRIVCGVDEAGRGPLAGPVYAAAVVLHPRKPIKGLADSKALTEARRQELAEIIKERAVAWSIASASVEEIDRFNILRATWMAMQRAVRTLQVTPDVVKVDGNQAPSFPCAVEAIVKGDAKVRAISAASILAKTARDAELMRLHEQYPEYGLDQHKGYATPLHLERLKLYGVSPIHRRSFAPVRQLLKASRPPVPDLFGEIW